MGTVLIFAEISTMPALRRACQDQGHDPVFLCEHPLPVDHPHELLDPWRSPRELGSEISHRFGRPIGIVNCVEGYVGVAESLAQHFALPTVNGTAAATLRDKSAMKRCWVEHGVRTPEPLFVGSGRVPEVEPDRFPLIVKPVFGAASAGVAVVHNMDELRRARRAVLRFNISALAREGHEHSGLIVEEYVDGPEYCVDQIWVDGLPAVQAVLSKGTPRPTDLMDRLYVADPELADAERLALLDLAARACRAAGVRNGATHTEIRKDASRGEFFVIEAALRPGAGCGLYPTYERAYGLPMFAALIRACTGAQGASADAVPRRARARHYWYNVPYSQSGRITALGTTHGFHDRYPHVNRII